MMENAGRALAELARRLLGGDVAGCRVVVAAGRGRNGGGILVAGRQLAVAGAAVSVVLADSPETLAPVTRDQHEIVRWMGIAALTASELEGSVPDLVVDALLGYGQRGADGARLIATSAGRRVLALETPSGLELATGTLQDPHVVAEATLKLAAPKEGLRSPEAARTVGRLFLGDISLRPSVYERLGVEYRSPFSAGPIVEIR